MYNKKLIPLALLGIVLLTAGFSCGRKDETPATNTNQDTNVNVGGLNQLPSINGGTDNFLDGNGLIGKQLEQLLFADFYNPTPLGLFPQAAQYTLPLDVKTEIQNYRDVSRKINLDVIEEALANNGFAVVTSARDFDSQNFQRAYSSLRSLEVPALITSDAVGFNYRLALHHAFKQIERDVFYDNTWHVLRSLYTKAKNRYELLLSDSERDNDLLLEANRLEMAFAATGLKLLQPQDFQVDKNTSNITPDLKSFTPQDRLRYDIQLPDYLTRQVDDELELIRNRPRASQKSPIFLYDSDYTIYEIPPEYQTSEKLKNFWLAARWLSDKTFLINFQGENCPACLIDEADNKIHLMAASLIAQDFTDDQQLKNTWLRVYKTMAYFLGLEQELSYLEFAQILAQEFGDDFLAPDLFSDFDEATTNVNRLRQALNAITYLPIEGGQSANTPQRGMKLLRQAFSPDQYLFNQLTYPQVGPRLDNQAQHFSACRLENVLVRCSGSGLDVANTLQAARADILLDHAGANQYSGYADQLGKLMSVIEQFDSFTWHQNVYWSTLFANRFVAQDFGQGYPPFMQQALWRNKELNTFLSTWLNVGSRPIIESAAPDISEPSSSLIVPDAFSIQQGYIEPTIEYYNQLLANTNMLIDGLVLLQIVNDNSPAIKTLTNLSNHLKRITEISLKELAGQEIEWHEYKFINEYDLEFNRAIGSLTDNSFNVFQNRMVHAVRTNQGVLLGNLQSRVDKLNILTVVYTDHTGKKFLASGPVLSYRENRSNAPASYADWQTDYIITP